MRYLSDAWIAALDEAVRAHPGVLAAAAQSPDVVIQQVVTGAPDGDVAYRIRVCDGAVDVASGADTDADIRLTTDVETAAAIARGETAAQEAFMRGRLRIGGHVTALLDQNRLFTALLEATAGVHERTEW